jgi:crossover junction endodeoxyribonuclease RuvC
MTSETKIMGIDPGLAAIGWCYIVAQGDNVIKMEYGCIRTDSKEPLPERLQKIHDELRELGRKYKPDELAIEEIIFSSNQLTAIQVAQARGVSILAFSELGVTIYEYSPPEIKRSVVGYGRATKDQVQKMLMQILDLEKPPRPSHASDAIATALCHIYHNCNKSPN